MKITITKDTSGLWALKHPNGQTIGLTPTHTQALNAANALTTFIPHP